MVDLDGPSAIGFRRSLAITIKPRVGDAWPVEAVLHERSGTMPGVFAGEFRVDPAELLAVADPELYGRKLGAALFTGGVRDAFARAVGGADPLHLLLSLDAPELRPLLWERLCGPQADGFKFLGLDQRVAYARYIPSAVARQPRELRRGELRALVVIACPTDLEAAYELPPFDADAAAATVRGALQDIACDVLGAVDGAIGPATLDAVCATLTRGAYAILHVVAHGQWLREQKDTVLYLEDRDRTTHPIKKQTLLDRLGLLGAALPHFMFFAACQSAVESGDGSLGGLARGIVGDLGVPAVLAMNSLITGIETADALTRAFYDRLRVHGHVDEALVEAGAGIADRVDALVPALYSRLGPLPLFVADDAAERTGTPEPEWSDPDLREWSLTIERAYAMRDRLRRGGQAIDGLEAEIWRLRMRLRKDGNLHAGDILGDGRYLLIGMAGEGLSSSVWRAHDRQLDRMVAIKSLHPQLLRHDGVVRQFKRGAERMRALEHPHIVRVLATAVEEDRRLYYITDLLPGATLQDLVLRRRLAPDAILPIVRALGSALVHAHAHALLHRDVEPSNVLFDAEGRACLGDFDLALARGRILETGQSFASPSVYIAPECLSPQPEATEASDVYGLAMTALFMIKGAAPFDVIAAPRRAIVALPLAPPVRRALLRAVAFTPARRFATVAAFLAALDAPEPAWRRPSVQIAAALGLGVLLATCALAVAT